MFLPHGSRFGNAMLSALAELTEPGEGNDCGCEAEAQPGEHPAPSVLSRANAWPELESSVCSHTENKHVGTQDLGGRQTDSKAFLMVPQRKEEQIPAITCSIKLEGSFSILEASEVICGIWLLQIHFSATRREASLVTLRNHLRKICVD